MRPSLITLAFFAVAAPAIAARLEPAPGKPKMDRPVVTCGDATPASIDLEVCAGASGMPAGFSIQWMTAGDFASHTEAGPDGFLGTADDVTVSNTWFASDDARLCKASFSGNANLSRYNLLPGECVTVRIGDILLDSGASATCTDAHPCGTAYVFRSFAHANSSRNRSDFTANSTCLTDACDSACDPAVLSQGYWKTHELDTQALVPDTITIGCQVYTAAQLDLIFDQTPAGGNGLVSLAHQVIATRLNILNGASPAYVAATATSLAEAEAVMCTTAAVPPVGNGFLANALTSALTLALDAEIGTFHCQ